MKKQQQSIVVSGQRNHTGLPVRRVMMLAGETSGDGMAAGLVEALKKLTANQFELICFGAGGERMKAAGVEILEDMTRHTVFGLSEVVRHYFEFKKIFQRLLDEVFERKPDLIILTDYAGFNLRFAKAVRKRLARSGGRKNDLSWNPRILYYVSPQVWASRASRVFTLSQCVDCVLSLFPFEKPWYAMRAPLLRVEFVQSNRRHHRTFAAASVAAWESASGIKTSCSDHGGSSCADSSGASLPNVDGAVQSRAT
jgi:lipid A disaccharide synthetase